MLLQRKKDEDAKYNDEFNQFRIGTKNQGGGSPIRDGRGDVVT
jgi:hypothetical protein